MEILDIIKDILEFMDSGYVVEIATLISGALVLLTNLVPTSKDWNWLRILQALINSIIPNRKVGGGTFSTYKNDEDKPVSYLPKDNIFIGNKEVCSKDPEMCELRTCEYCKGMDEEKNDKAVG